MEAHVKINIFWERKDNTMLNHTKMTYSATRPSTGGWNNRQSGMQTVSQKQYLTPVDAALMGYCEFPEMTVTERKFWNKSETKFGDDHWTESRIRINRLTGNENGRSKEVGWTRWMAHMLKGEQDGNRSGATWHSGIIFVTVCYNLYTSPNLRLHRIKSYYLYSLIMHR